MERSNDSSSWTEQRMRALDPPADWEPASMVALAHLRQRIEERHRPSASVLWRRWVLATALGCLVLSVLPGTRGVAQWLWELIQVTRADFVRINVNELPKSLTAHAIRKPDRIEAARDVEDASTRAGFVPRLPSRVVAGPPRLSVSGPMSFVMTVHAGDLEAALRKAGADDLAIPPEWDGTSIGLHTGALVYAEYQDFTLIQTPPLNIATPPGFVFQGFSEAMMRALGVPRLEAARLAAAGPAWLLPIEPDDAVVIRQVRLDSGPATLLHDLNGEGQVERVSLLWSTSDRLYAISADASDELVIAAANSVQ